MVKVGKTIKVLSLSILLSIFLFLLLDRLYPLDRKRLYKPQSTLIYDRHHQLLRLHLSEDGFLRIPIESSEITEDIRQTLLAYEDHYFYHHFGINPISLARAAWFNLRNRRTIGASTLTMQVARMMHRKPRTVGNKLIEMFISLQLEYHYSKDEILEMYLNNTPYGGNIEGFSSAAFAYFDTPVESLSLAQIAYLIAIPQNPNLNLPKKESKNFSRINRLKEKVLTRLYDDDGLSQERYSRAMQESLSPHRADLVYFAPQLSAKFRGGGKVVTTIDLSLQQQIEYLLKDKIEILNQLHIYNAAAIVIDNRDMTILAYVGSQDFRDKRYGGEVDGLKALVSPGSTLKPFIYAKALEQGLITPLRKLYDIPLSIEGYKPLNYSEQFLGEVTAKEALQLSLNIPAVELDRLLGDASLYSLLKQANISSINHPKDYYGSSLTLGGCGITLKNLAELFASFANKGLYRNSSFLPHSPPIGQKILTEESSYLISQILVDAPRQSFTSSWEYMGSSSRVAFKTGTSANARDMLSIGYTPEYTVAVWYGNFDGSMGKSLTSSGKKERRLTGLAAASPTLLDIFGLLKPKEWFVKPQGIKSKKICQDTIEIGACREYIYDEVIDGVDATLPCHLLRAEVLATLFDRRRISSMEELSSHTCYPMWRAYDPLITSPVDGQKQIQNRLLPQEFKKTKLQCYAFETNTTILWLIDNDPPLEGKSGIPLYRYLPPGKHQIRCLDQGAKMREINVEMEERF
ncbi:MAG: penicillin-binding protein 1C [Campylobacterota bacterium]|nr:penicillin-binding protein 1C [Campylobacterota bacterium]